MYGRAAAHRRGRPTGIRDAYRTTQRIPDIRGASARGRMEARFDISREPHRADARAWRPSGPSLAEPAARKPQKGRQPLRRSADSVEIDPLKRNGSGTDPRSAGEAGPSELKGRPVETEGKSLEGRNSEEGEPSVAETRGRRPAGGRNPRDPRPYGRKAAGRKGKAGKSSRKRAETPTGSPSRENRPGPARFSCLAVAGRKRRREREP
jgi:hypothetical protein